MTQVAAMCLSFHSISLSLSPQTILLRSETSTYLNCVWQRQRCQNFCLKFQEINNRTFWTEGCKQPHWHCKHVSNSGPGPERILTVLHFGAGLFINLQTPELRIMPPLGILLSQFHQIHFYPDIKIGQSNYGCGKTLIFSTQIHFIVQADQVLL